MRWYYACKVNEATVFFEGIYTSGNSRTATLVRPNIQKKIVDTSRAWDDITYVKYRKVLYFSKESISSGNSRMAGLVRPNIQKKIADTCVDEMILCM